MYNVVLKVIDEHRSDCGVITWTSYKDKEAFDKCREELQGEHEVVAEGVSQECAIELCSSSDAQNAALAYRVRSLLS